MKLLEVHEGEWADKDTEDKGRRLRLCVGKYEARITPYWAREQDEQGRQAVQWKVVVKYDFNEFATVVVEDDLEDAKTRAEEKIIGHHILRKNALADIGQAHRDRRTFPGTRSQVPHRHHVRQRQRHAVRRRCAVGGRTARRLRDLKGGKQMEFIVNLVNQWRFETPMRHIIGFWHWGV